MKKYALCLMMSGFILGVLALSGCTVAPPARPRSGGIIYDEKGRAIYIPPSAQKPPVTQSPTKTPESDPSAAEIGQYPAEGTVMDSSSEDDPYSTEINQYPSDETRTSSSTGRTEPASLPPRIGSADEDGDSGNDEYLVAAVTPLADQARSEMARGELDRAMATAERAVRIDSSNPDLWHLMAQIQLEKENYTQAEQLARKSNLLAKNDRTLQSENWKIIAISLEKRGNIDAARDAMRRAGE